MNIEKAWKKFLKTIIENGESHTKDDGDVLQESLINHCFVDNVLNQFGNQNITTEMFLDMIKQGKYIITLIIFFAELFISLIYCFQISNVILKVHNKKVNNIKKILLRNISNKFSNSRINVLKPINIKIRINDIKLKKINCKKNGIVRTK